MTRYGNKNWLFLLLLVFSCTRKDIEFGDNPETNYTHIVYTDTISVNLSTVVRDSFATQGAGTLLLGRYSDPYLGVVSAKPFFQMAVPTNTVSIPASAVYDSLTFIFRLSDYYYGDTSRNQTFYVDELAASITPTYNSSLFNSSAIAVLPTPLGSRTVRISPVGDDSVSIRLSDTKGQELFTKLRNQVSEVTNNESFLTYFRGISLRAGTNDTTAIYGISAATGNMVMRVHYHTTIPYPEKQHIDFTSLSNDYTFNQVIASRNGTGLPSGNTTVVEIPSSATNNHALLQPGTGVYIKMTFPGLRSIINADKIVRLLKAELLLRPAYLSFDSYKYKLPSQLYLASTDASNTPGAAVYDSTGAAILYANPVTDGLYGENNYYRFNVTDYINQLLNTTGSESMGFFLMKDISTLQVDRLVLNNALLGSQASRLQLQLLVINK